MLKRNTLLCTVGTSLFEGNLSRLSEKTVNAPLNWCEIKNAYNQQNWKDLAVELLKVSPTERVCGAEINTVEEIRKRNLLTLENLIFLVSDTKHGENTGKFLKHYFEQREDLSLRAVEYQVIGDLQDERPMDFKVRGLRNLVRLVGENIQRFGLAEVAIDATGGYKAQIAIAVIIGQALNIPVFYKHERFSEIIEFPPLPISFDYEMLGSYADLLADFEQGKTFTVGELGKLDDKLRVLLTEIVVEGRSMVELSAIGQVYLTSFRIHHPKSVN